MSEKVFFCEMCDYATKYSSDFTKHQRSRKHQSKTRPSENLTDDRRFTCSECGNSYTRRSNLSRHRLQCKKNYMMITHDYQDGLDLTEYNETENYKKSEETVNIPASVLIKMLEDFQEKEKKLIDIIDKQKHQNNNYGTINNMNNNTFMMHITQNYNEAPPLKSLTTDELLAIEHYPDKDLLDAISFYYAHKEFPKYIAELIVQVYKKEDPAEQSLWSSDVARLSYIIRRQLKNNKHIWDKDSRGLTIIQVVIKPILEFIDKEIMKYFKKIRYEKIPTKNLIERQEKLSRLAYIQDDIQNGRFDEKILKHMAPFFKPINESLNINKNMLMITKKVD